MATKLLKCGNGTEKLIFFYEVDLFREKHTPQTEYGSSQEGKGVLKF